MTNTTRQRATYVIADLIGAAIAMFLFNIYRHQLLAADMPLNEYLSLNMVVTGQIIFPLMIGGVFYLSGYYNSVFQKSRLQDLLMTFGSCVAGTLLIVFIALIDDFSMDRQRDYTLFGVLFVILFGCIWTPRLIITGITARKLRRGQLYTKVAIVGYGSCPDEFAQQIKHLRPSMGLKPVALVSLDEKSGDTVCGLKILSSATLEQECSPERVSRIILLPHPSGEWKPTMQVLRQLMKLRQPVLMPYNRATMPMSAGRHLDVGAEPLINVTRPYISPSTENMKRCGDIAVSAVAIALLAIPVAIIALAIRISTGDSPIYKQRRLGRGGKPFNIYKLRTMRCDAEPEGTPMLATPDDPRITAIGAFLRKYRLDELPQFWNVLRGDMSIVGPRPEREYYVDAIVRLDPAYVLLHQVRPGITSWGMVKYGYASTVGQMLERMRYDLLYIENMSFLLDLKILFYTFHTVLTGKGL